MDSPWHYSTLHSSACQIVEEQTVWGQAVCRVWLPGQDVVVRVPRSALRPLDGGVGLKGEVDRIAYIAAAAKVAELLEGSGPNGDGAVLLAPMESNVIPLPHQIHALSRAISGDRVRYLLADEVGLGKTIEAGLILRELKLRGRVRRALVVAPKSLAMQWVAEMDTHFNEPFALVNPGDLEALERLERPAWLSDEKGVGNHDYNPWLRFPQAIVTLDAVKPLARRRGWSKEKVQAYNQNRYERLIQAQWDLIIVDESHRLGGSTDQVARFKLGQGLAEAAPYLLLLSATPHQGKSDAFQRLMSLLDPMAFPDIESVTRQRVSDFVIRTEKRKAMTAEGKPLFRPRTTQTIGVCLERNPAQVALYEAVTEYVLSLENPRVRGIAMHLPQQFDGQPVPAVTIPGLPISINGFWGLFEIRLAIAHATHAQVRIPPTRRAFVSVFVDENGKCFLPTARHIWDALQTSDCAICSSLRAEESLQVAAKLKQAIEDSGRQVFENLQRAHGDAMATEAERGRISFEARRRSIQRIGLPEVRHYRMNKCAAEEAEWRKELDAARETIPEIRPLLMLKVN